MQNNATRRHRSNIESASRWRYIFSCSGLATAFGVLAMIHSAAHAASPAAVSRVCDAMAPGNGAETKSPIIVNRLKADGWKLWSNLQIQRTAAGSAVLAQSKLRSQKYLICVVRAFRSTCLI